MRALVVATLAVTVLTACADAAGPARPAEIGTRADCLADEVLVALGASAVGTWSGRPAPAAGTVPEGFEPVRVVECGLAPAVVRGPVAHLEVLDDELSGHVVGDVDMIEHRDAPLPSPPPSSVTVERVERVGDLDRLLAALAQPSDEPGPDTLCPAVLELRPVIFLIDGTDRAVRVAWPTTECGSVVPGALEALAAVPEVDRTVVTRERE